MMCRELVQVEEQVNLEKVERVQVRVADILAKLARQQSGEAVIFR